MLDLEPIRARRAGRYTGGVEGGDIDWFQALADLDALVAEVERLREFEWMYKDLCD